MQKFLLLSIFVVLLTTGAPSRAGAAQPRTKVIMTTGSFSEREAVMFVAQDQGLFRRHGLDLTFVHVRSGPVGMAAIAGGETQLHEGSATGAVLGQPRRALIWCLSPVSSISSSVILWRRQK